MTMRIYGGAIALALAFAMTAGCSNVPEPLAAAAVAPADACATLARLSIARTDIGLPTNGATVTGVSLVAAKDGSREYCKVLVRIASVDAASPPINMQINLPSDWNRKAFQMGGGGFDGFLVTGEGPVPGAAKFPTPLSKGFVTFGSDGGHGTSEAFAAEEHIAAFLHDEVIANYTSDQLKKTHDVAMRIVRTRYGALPEKTYIAGGSNGGRETLDAEARTRRSWGWTIRVPATSWRWRKRTRGSPTITGWTMRLRRTSPAAWTSIASPATTRWSCSSTPRCRLSRQRRRSGGGCSRRSSASAC